MPEPPGNPACPLPAQLLRILLIEDSEDDALLMLLRFRGSGYRVEHLRVADPESMRRALAENVWDVILADHRMPGFSALAALRLMQETTLDLPFIIVSGVLDEETAITVMREGAHDYLSKDKLERLIPAVERELREARNRAERQAALRALQENEARFRALASNIPGMVLQMQQEPDGTLRALYASEGCQALLGCSPAQVMSDPQRFFGMILAEDRPRLAGALQESARNLSTVNWEGQIVLNTRERKWINLRASPRVLDGGAILWEGIVSNISHSKLTEMELRESRTQLAELSSHLQRVKEEERERIARDIHDVLGGNLVAIKIEASLLAGKLDSDPQQRRQRVRGIEKLIDEAINTCGRVARELRPGILKEFGLAAAIECQAEDFTQRTSIPCHVLCADYDADPGEDTAVALFRIFQETLTNISKHAQASVVEVRLHQEDHDVVLEIRDDGRGVTADDLNKPRSFGLRGIRERINSLGGSFAIQPRAGGGTEIVLRAPLAATAASATDWLIAGAPGQSLLFDHE